MEEIFKPNSLSIKEIFGNADSLYQIPRYQRPYSWGDEQLEKLWEDLVDAKENEPNYFLGSIITAKPEDNNNYLDIVDGQQRLTTLTILLCVYRDLYPEINNGILEEDPFAIDGKTVSNSIKFNDRFQRLRLRTHSNHQSDFDKLILSENATVDSKEIRKPTKQDLRKDEPKFKFKNSAFFFREKLTSIGEKEAGELLNYLFNKVKIIRIDCKSVSFAIKLFQVLNDRGLDLSNSDLIKSFLIEKIQKKYNDESEIRKQKEEQFMDDWKECENCSNNTETTLNDLFVMYEYYLLAQNPKKSLYDELRNELKDKDSNETIADIKNFIRTYQTEIFDKENKIIYSFFYIPWGMYWRTILLTALKEKYSEYEEFVKVFRRYYYLNWIAGNTLSKIKQTSFNLIKSIKEKKTLQNIKEELNNSLVSDNTIRKAIENLSGDIYNEKWCKPLLFLIEYNQTDDSNISFLDIANRNVQVEHILPQKYYNNEDWKTIFEKNDETNSWLNSGRNLTLLSGKKNVEAGNRDFETKIKSYTGKGFYSNNQEGITAFRMTQQIVDNYNKGLFGKQWNKEALKDRWNWFCAQVETILEIDLTEIKE